MKAVLLLNAAHLKWYLLLHLRRKGIGRYTWNLFVSPSPFRPPDRKVITDTDAR
jgi:hypothetical protein